MAMEARLSQHICFRTSKERSEKQLSKVPVLKIPDSEKSLNEGFSSPILSSPMLNGPEKSFLFLPKNDNRNRLTSTPNQELASVTPVLRHGSDAAFDFSPLGFCGHDRSKLHSLENDPKDMDDIKGILFPKLQKAVSGNCATGSAQTNNITKRKRSPNNSEESSPTLHQKAKSIMCNNEDKNVCIPEPVFAGFFEKTFLQKENNVISPCSPAKIRSSINFENSYQDSGFNSLAASFNSDAMNTTRSVNFEESGSLPHSPLKRRAEKDFGNFSVESPMKRLAFMSLDNGQRITKAEDDSCMHLDSVYENSNLFEEPGSSFLNLTPEKSTFTDLPPPIFPNAVQIDCSLSSRNCDDDVIKQKTNGNALDDFEFTKPSVVLRRKKVSEQKRTFPNVVPVTESKVGLQHFDIIKELSMRNLYNVVAKIFTHVRQKDILRCSYVSLSWKNICDKNTFVRRQIKSLKNQYKNEESTRGSENLTAKKAVENALLKSPAKIGSRQNLTTGRMALSSLQARVRQSPMKPVLMPTTPSGKNHFVRADSKFEHNQGVKRTLQFEESLMPCPKCSWTAKIYANGQRNGQCYRVECRYRFCIECKSDYHWPKPCTMRIITSPVKEAKSIKAGTKKSKIRLKKRLLM